jgi:hypothetical protein
MDFPVSLDTLAFSNVERFHAEAAQHRSSAPRSGLARRLCYHPAGACGRWQLDQLALCGSRSR